MDREIENDRDIEIDREKEKNEVIPSDRFIIYGLAAFNRALVGLIISPTNYFYFKDIFNDGDTAKWYTGLQSTTYNIGAVFGCTLIGFLLDLYGQPKRFIILLTFLHIIGMTLYSIPIGNVVLLGQFLNGFGSTVIVVVRYSLTVRTSQNDMGKYLSFVNFCGFFAQFSIFLVWVVYPKANIYIGEWRIWSGNIPGVTMFVNYLFTLVSCFIFYGRDTPMLPDVNVKKEGTNKEKHGFFEKLKETKELFKRLEYITLLLHGVFLGCCNICFAILVPIVVDDCFNLKAKYSVTIILIPSIAQAIVWASLPTILKKVCYYDLLLSLSIGGLVSLLILSFLPEQGVCIMVIVVFFYITLFLVPAKRTIVVSIIGYTLPKDTLGTAQSSYQLAIKLSGIFVSLGIGYFANHKEVLAISLLCLGTMSTFLLIFKRGTFRKPLSTG